MGHIPSCHELFSGGTMNPHSMQMTIVKFAGFIKVKRPFHKPKERVLLSWSQISCHLIMDG